MSNPKGNGGVKDEAGEHVIDKNAIGGEDMEDVSLLARAKERLDETTAQIKIATNRTVDITRAHVQDPCGTAWKFLITSWVFANVALLPFFMAATSASAAMSEEGLKGPSFGLIWTVFHCVALLAIGTVVLKNHLDNEIAYGCFSAGCLFMASWMLQTVALLASDLCVITLHHTCPGHSASNPAADGAAMIFGLLIVAGYAATGINLVRNKAIFIGSAADMQIVPPFDDDEQVSSI